MVSFHTPRNFLDKPSSDPDHIKVSNPISLDPETTRDSHSNKIESDRIILETDIARNDAQSKSDQFLSKHDSARNEISHELSQNFKKGNQSRLRPEADMRLITEIFGHEVQSLDHYDSKFILDLENWELPKEEFQRRFLIESKKENPEHLKCYESIRCKVSSSSSTIVIGQCGTACGVKFDFKE